MKCPSCAAAVMVSDRRDVPYVYRGESTMIRAVTGQFQASPVFWVSAPTTESSPRQDARRANRSRSAEISFKLATMHG